MHSLKIASFLFPRIEGTIASRQYIKAVNIDYEMKASFGNEYIRLTYQIEANELFEKLPEKQQKGLFKGSSNLIITIASNRSPGRYDHKKNMLSIIEFKHCYESLAAYAVLQLEAHLEPGTPIRAKGVDLWPEANYAEKYIDYSVKDSYGTIMQSSQHVDADQWIGLLRLAKKSSILYAREKLNFNITDVQIIAHLNSYKLYSIRHFLLSHDVAIHIKTIKTIEEVHIHTSQLFQALKKELQAEFAWHRDFYTELIQLLYQQYLPVEKEALIQSQQAEFLQQLLLQPGDIVELKDKRLVYVNALAIDGKNRVQVTYAILKNNLEPGNKTRTVDIDTMQFVLKSSDFTLFLQNNPVKHLSILKKWMRKHKLEISPIVFQPDLTRALTMVS
ncbi:MAG: hypothetical protein P0Y53_20860 [Candidatus Pseudobacter hemicellulosilyticus]|uniref:Uncharacterized protein n=1 Tax=Candidatus Pseudobacter hemicellulosilyticus TaxID=3121375 RepID=A0AAJ5WQN6_9BACT|nr:MAG: hypothetical protein P0Y53_20860 [Pseudobacter sp.]